MSKSSLGQTSIVLDGHVSNIGIWAPIIPIVVLLGNPANQVGKHKRTNTMEGIPGAASQASRDLTGRTLKWDSVPLVNNLKTNQTSLWLPQKGTTHLSFSAPNKIQMEYHLTLSSPFTYSLSLQLFRVPIAGLSNASVPFRSRPPFTSFTVRSLERLPNIHTMHSALVK